MEPKDLLTFDKMLTPIFIRIVFWIGVGLCIIAGFAIIISGVGSGFGGAALALFMGSLYMIFGPLLVRVYCEIVMVFFKIHSTLVEIKDSLQTTPPASRQSPPGPPSPSAMPGLVPGQDPRQ